MFRAIISTILRNARLCLQLWYNAPTKLPAGSIVGALYHKREARLAVRFKNCWLEGHQSFKGLVFTLNCVISSDSYCT